MYAGYVVGTLLFVALLGWGAWRQWRSRQRVASVLLGLWGLACLVGLVGMPLRPNRAAALERMEEGFVDGCAKGCARTGGGTEFNCWNFCRCTADRLGARRDTAAFVAWVTKHSPGGVPDGVMTEALKSSAEQCGDRL